MYRIIRKSSRFILIGFLVIGFSSCSTTHVVVRDHLVIEKLRLRITKVRNAIAETRSVIAASRGAPYLPEIYMRLAELLSEEARYHHLLAYEREQRSTKSLHVPHVRMLKEEAISTYQFILKAFPKSHLSDRILFNISHEQRELGQFEEMKVTLEKLVKEYPSSKYHSEALLVLGDYHFDKTEFIPAENYFSQILQDKDSPLLGMANYKLAWVKVNLGECPQALEHFEDAIVLVRKLRKLSDDDDSNNKTGGTHRAVDEFEIPEPEKKGFEYAGHKSLDVEREALVDLTYCYSQERKPEEAVDYLRNLASSREAYIAALTKLANRYAIVEQPQGAAQVARELLQLAPDDPERLDDARMLHNAITRMKDYRQVDEDVKLVLRAMRRQLIKPKIKKSAEQLFAKEFEAIARDMATKAHRMLMGKIRRSRWIRNPVSSEVTARAYLNYLDVLPDSKHRLEISQNLADVLMSSQEYLQSGNWYREASDLLAALIKNPPRPEEKKKEKANPQTNDPKKQSTAKTTKKKNPVKKKKENIELKKKEWRKQRLDALYNAVVAYQRALEVDGPLSFVYRATASAGLRKAGGQYLAEGQPDTNRSIRIKFAIAQTYYNEGKYVEAIDLLSGVAYEYPRTLQGNASVHMILDSYKTINDMNGLINAGRRFLGKDSTLTRTMKRKISGIVQAAEQKRIDELSLAASGDQASEMEVLMAFAKRYKDSELGERAMLSAFVAARASGETNQLYGIGEQILKAYPQSKETAGVIGTMGRTAAAQFDFDNAIKYLEQAAVKEANQKVTLLLAAGQLREQLADTNGALRDYQQALRTSQKPTLKSEAINYIADLTISHKTNREVLSVLMPYRNMEDPDVLSKLGMALLRDGRNDDATEYFIKVIDGALKSSPTAEARAHYGMAEVMLKILENLKPLPELDAIEEVIGTVDITMQSYLTAIRQTDLNFSQAALSRFAYAAEIGAQKLEMLQLPNTLSEQEKIQISDALASKARQLRGDAKTALDECAARVKTSFLFNLAGMACMRSQAPNTDPVSYTRLKPRNKISRLPLPAREAQQVLAKNPDDLDALKTLGLAFLEGNDAHAAKLVLAKAVEVGGGAEELNALGVAAYRAGDILAAMEAFGRAKDSGSNAAVHNLVYLLKNAKLLSYAQELQKTSSGSVDGILLSGSGGS